MAQWLNSSEFHLAGPSYDHYLKKGMALKQLYVFMGLLFNSASQSNNEYRQMFQSMKWI
jgi:hypothetical protein